MFDNIVNLSAYFTYIELYFFEKNLLSTVSCFLHIMIRYNVNAHVSNYYSFKFYSTAVDENEYKTIGTSFDSNHKLIIYL